jgi:hypothetical protein
MLQNAVVVIATAAATLFLVQYATLSYPVDVGIGTGLGFLSGLLTRFTASQLAKTVWDRDFSVSS